MLEHQSELGPHHVAAADQIEPERNVAVRSEGPFQRAAQIVDIGAMKIDQTIGRGGFPRGRGLAKPLGKMRRVPAAEVGPSAAG